MDNVRENSKNDIDNHPKMHKVAEIAQKQLSATILKVRTNDNIMSSVHIQGTHDSKDKWPNGIINNSRCFRFMITPSKQRYYTEGNKIQVELVTCCYRINEKFRKSITTPEKAIQRIADWIAKTA